MRISILVLLGTRCWSIDIKYNTVLQKTLILLNLKYFYSFPASHSAESVIGVYSREEIVFIM